MGDTAMDVRVVTRISINAPAQDVFCYLSNLRYHHIWNPHMRKVKPITELKRGMVYESENVLLGIKITNVNKVAKLSKNKEIELLNNKGQIQYRINYRLVPLNNKDKTQVVCTTVVTAVSSYFSFAKPALRMIAKRELQTDMQALKLAVEHKLGE
jgi:uncharacterized membrane protein